jgi:hypothetical protein
MFLRNVGSTYRLTQLLKPDNSIVTCNVFFHQ